jgi:hypothetical protein
MSHRLDRAKDANKVASGDTGAVEQGHRGRDDGSGAQRDGALHHDAGVDGHRHQRSAGRQIRAQRRHTERHGRRAETDVIAKHKL